ncbi:hypothetical protein BGZ68_008265 [Mortierella alpina]|nr:hypothetical protein BGZ68_008265 [Mortierella alpina]
MMTKLLETPPLINITPLTEIHEVPIHIHNPIHPSSANKHKRLGLQILNELSKLEMACARIEAVGKHDEVVSELAKTVAHLEQALYNFEQENGNPNRLDDPSGRILLQQCINQAGQTFMQFKARVEEQFNALKEFCNVSEEPYLTPTLQSWLTDLTTDIVAEALFSGRPMSQQTPQAAPLSDYINRVSSGNNWEEQIQAS